ncbi:MAG TPA: hypothetical protein VHE33_07185, partial [Acidobacteriaceae bacterium]|nr:hypothetical protein [Acidobacteriaceae bacterium]
MSSPSHINIALAAAHGITDRLIATWNPDLPRDPRVLVPVLVEALVVRQEGGQWADTSLKQTPESGDAVPTESLLPKPFALDSGARPKGVYLHWALPDALTKGTQTPNADASADTSNAAAVFPAVPDRWLVVRLSPSTTHPDRRAVKGWILQAHDKDAIRHDLDGWRDPGTPPEGLQKPLTALGWGDISWAGYFDNTENRLAMYDDLSGVKEGPLAYLVCGWYSDPQLDPLGPANVASLSQFNAAMQKLGWALPDIDLKQPKSSSSDSVLTARMVGLPVNRIRTSVQLNNFASSSDTPAGGLVGFDPTSGTYTTDGSWWPQMCLLHGAVVGIGWPGIGWEGNPTGVWNPKTLDPSIGQEEPGGPPDPAGIRVAMGNTVTEAMARLVATGNNRPDETRILEAFQLNALTVLNDADGPAKVDSLLHGRQFGSVPGEPYTETIWQPPTSVNQAPPAHPPKPGTGTFSRYKDAATKGPFGYGVVNPLGAVTKSVLTPATAGSRQIQQESLLLKGGLASAINQIGLNHPIPEPQPGKWITVQRTGPRLFHPSDPCLLIAGGKASFKHKLGAQSKDGMLYCRLTNDYADELSSPTVNIPGLTPQRPYARGADLLERGIENGSVPGECTGLLNELAVLDPGSSLHAARSFATSANLNATQTAALARSFLVEQTVWHATRDPRVDHGPLIAKSGFSGRLPSAIAINLPARPWNPIRLDWSVEFIPSANGAADWALGEIDYAPQGVNLGTPISFTGSSILTQGANNIVASAITKALEQAASAGGSGIRQPGILIKYVSTIAQKHVDAFSKIVSTQAAQSAGGASTGVPSVDRLPLDDIASALSDMDVLTGGLDGFTSQLRGGYRGDGSTVPPSSAPDPSPFFPWRAGFLRVTALRLVDGFGQFIDLLESNQQFQTAQIIKSDPMAVDGHDDLALLPPRFTSPARLLFEFVDAKDSGQRAVSDPQGGNPISPVCGYLMPNHLDGALEFFDTDGTNLGFVRPQDDATVMWEEAPGQPTTAGHDPGAAIPNPHAAEIAKALVRWSIADAGVPGERDDALQAILRVIDATLWTVDPFGHIGDEHLALLVGHPVAIIRARITLQLREPIRPDLANTTLVPLRLGALAHWQDGLFGYFVNDDYTRLYCSDAAAAGLARAIGPGTGFLGAINSVPDQLTNFAADTGTTPVTHPYIDTSGIVMIRPNQTIDLTLLLEPHSVVHATAGLLPRKEIGLRRDWTDAALSKLSPTFRFGPVLVDPQRIRMPVPIDLNGTWSWDHRADINTWQEQEVTN